MKKNIRIYNKKGFRGGILSLAISSADLLVMLWKPSDSFFKNGRMLFLALLLLVIGFFEIRNSLNAEKSRQDEQANDERERLIDWKSGALTAKITWYACVAAEVLLMIVWYDTKFQALLSSILTLGLLINFMMVLSFAVSLYLDKKN